MMFIWIWGNPLTPAMVEAWSLQGHQVLYCPFQEPEVDMVYFRSVTNSRQAQSLDNVQFPDNVQSPDLVLVTDWEDRLDPGLRQEVLHALALIPQQTKVLFHAVAQPFPSDGPSGWAAWNGWPDGQESDCWEIAIPALHDNESLRHQWRALAAELQRELVFCPNRGGMVTPRVLACIINEAYLTRDQGIATDQDIDKGMRYGTNYPRGPFEWCSRIGAQRLVHALDAWAKQDPGQDAYKVAEGLRQQASSTV
jgi:3-hydroxybutyryl-CoA dehydrogenase